nr:hypothetical protein [Tanacetum cinerariifolium]
DPGENSSPSPPHIEHQCCYGYGDSLGGIFCQRCTCESCGNSAHHGYNCPPKDENSFAYDSTPNFVNDSPNVFNPPSQPPTYSYEFCGNDAHFSHDCPPQVLTIQAWLQQRKDQVVNFGSYSSKPLQYRKIPIYYNDDDDKESSTPLRDIIISEHPSCIAITPILSPKETKDSLIMGDEHLNTILEKELDEFIKSSVENLILTQIDSLLDEFAGELIFLKSIPPGIHEADCDLEEEIHLIEKLFYDNSSPRIDSDYSNFEGDNLFPERLLHDDPIPLLDILDSSNVV